MNRSIFLIFVFLVGCTESALETSVEKIAVLETLVDPISTDQQVYEDSKQKDTIPTVAFNENPIYFAENGITLKASTLAKPGDQFLFQGILYTIVNNDLLRETVANEREDLSQLITTYVTDMSFLFQGKTTITPNITAWDTSNVIAMNAMFRNTPLYNGLLNYWDTSKVTTMSFMFADTGAFNQNISSWDTSKVTQMNAMFNNAEAFIQNLSVWCVSEIKEPPINFSLNSKIPSNFIPLWGSCEQ